MTSHLHTRLWAGGLLGIFLSLSASVAQAQDATPSDSSAETQSNPAPAADAAPADGAPVADATTAPAADSAPSTDAATASPTEQPAATAQEAAPTVAVEPVRPETPEPLASKSDEGATRLGTVEVTGSRLKRADVEGSQPIVTISRADLDRSGLTDISEILRNLTVAGNNSLTAAQGRFALTMGETNLDLRNLGSNHTLLLVNGRRWVTGLIQTQTSVSDYNTIPTAIIERIEVLKDGASAIYGSDAIGGVVNVITRKNFEGGAISYHLGQFYKEGDGTNQQASLSWGMNRPGGNLFMNLSYTDQATAPNENRPFTASPNVGPTRNSIVTQNALLRFVELDSTHAALYQCPNLQAGIAAGAAEGTPVGGPIAMTQVIPAGLVLCDLTLNQGGTGGAGNPLDYHQINRATPTDTYNRFADGTLKEPNKRIAFYTQFEQELTENISFSFEGMYNRRSSTSVGQNSYLGGGNLDGGPRAYLAYISASNPNNPLAQEIGFDSSCGGLGDTGADPKSVSCTGVGDGSGSWAIRRAPGLNNQNFVDTVDTIRLGGGLKGQFEILSHAFQWDGGYVLSRNKINETLSSTNYEKAGKALGAFGTTCDGDCVPLNVFQGAAGLTQAAVDYVLVDAYQRNNNRQEIAYLNLSTDIGSAEFLAGPVAMAMGIEFRREQYISAIDPIIQNGLIRLNSQNPLSGVTYAREGYVEFGIPLFKDLPLAKDVELDIAGRASNYPRIGMITTGKAGIRWQPFEDLLLRSTISTGFRAPNIGELFLGAAQSFDPLLDPCADPGTNNTADMNCLTDGTPGGGQGGNVVTPYDLWQGNPDLKPEKSKNLTYGLVYSPHWLPDFSIGLDFFQIGIKDFVVIGEGQYFLDSCYKETPRNYCDKIHRDGTGGLTFVDTPYFNLAQVDTGGVDISLAYTLPMPVQAGHFKLSLDGSYLKEFTYTSPQPGGADQVDSQVGKASGQFQGYPRWKAGGVLSWEIGDFKASWSTRMAYHMVESCGDLFPTPSLKDLGLCSDPNVVDSEGNSTPENKLHTVFYHNVQIGYDLTRINADITVGVNNVLNQNPEISRSGSSLYWYNYDPNQYEVPGRFGYVRASFKF